MDTDCQCATCGCAAPDHVIGSTHPIMPPMGCESDGMTDGGEMSPGSWVPPAGVRPAWNWTPPYGLTARLDRVPLWVRFGSGRRSWTGSLIPGCGTTAAGRSLRRLQRAQTTLEIDRPLRRNLLRQRNTKLAPRPKRRRPLLPRSARGDYRCQAARRACQRSGPFATMMSATRP